MLSFLSLLSGCEDEVTGVNYEFIAMVQRQFLFLNHGTSAVNVTAVRPQTFSFDFSLCQISEIHVTGESEDMTAKERLLLWSKQITEGYVGVRCDNFTTSWRDGRLFNAIIHKYR